MTGFPLNPISFPYAWIVIATMTIALPGCGPTHTPMHGQVTLDGQPLDEAAILFVPLDKGRKKTGAGVVQGSYELKAEDGLLPGKYRVEVADNPPLTGSHDTTGNKSATAVKRRVIPEKYARESPLLVEVDGQSGSASREYNCDLKSGR